MESFRQRLLSKREISMEWLIRHNTNMEKKWVRDQLGKGEQAKLAKHLKVTESKMSKMLSDNNKRPLREREATLIREFFRPDARNRSYAELHSDSTVRQPDEQITLPNATERPPDILVYRTGMGPSAAGGDFTMSVSEVALRVRRPPKLADRTDIYGLFVRGDTMAPRYENGELILLETGPPPRKHDHVVVRLKADKDDLHCAYLKLLVSWVGDKIELRQYNPEKTITLNTGDVDAVHRVMTTQDLVNK
jgi:phage repressor protein C with HTH and peptisase S24 domain